MFKPNSTIPDHVAQMEMQKCDQNAYNMLGHLIFNPSNHRMYSNSAMGDFRLFSSLLTEDEDDDEDVCVCPDVAGSPVMSS